MMSPVIRLDEEVFAGLKKIAEPFEDTPNTVIRRLLVDKGLIPKQDAASSTEPTNASRTPQEFFRLPILQALDEMGGKGRTRDVLEKVGTQIKDKLIPHDFSKTSTGGTRWRVYARWERVKMRKEGLVTGPRGCWTITEKGRSLLKDANRQH